MWTRVHRIKKVIEFFFSLFFDLLDLSRNQISYISDQGFMGLNNLTSLDLSYNELQSLPTIIFEPFYNLTTFNVSGNHMIDKQDLKNSIKVSFLGAIIFSNR